MSIWTTVYSIWYRVSHEVIAYIKWCIAHSIYRAATQGHVCVQGPPLCTFGCYGECFAPPLAFPRRRLGACKWLLSSMSMVQSTPIWVSGQLPGKVKTPTSIVMGLAPWLIRANPPTRVSMIFIELMFLTSIGPRLRFPEPYEPYQSMWHWLVQTSLGQPKIDQNQQTSTQIGPDLSPDLPLDQHWSNLIKFYQISSTLTKLDPNLVLNLYKLIQFGTTFTKIH